MPYQEKCKLVKKEILKDDIFKFTVETENISKEARPGQFLEIRVADNVEPFLRRPISIYNLDKENFNNLCEPTRTGYDFKGWSLTNGGEILKKEEQNLNYNDLNLYAVWEAHEYDVTYENNTEK